MRRCADSLIKSVLFACILLAAITGTVSAEVEEVVEETFSTWSSTIYYLAELNGPNKPYNDVTIYITAVDEYTLYVNGDEIGSDDDWTTVEQWPVSISGESIMIGVKVTNYGQGNGNGLMVDVKDANSDWLGTSTWKRRSEIINASRQVFPVAWYYYQGDAEADFDPWYNPSSSYFESQAVRDGWQYVQLGTMGDFGYNPDNHIEIVTGYPSGDIDTGSIEEGGLTLRRIEGENLALGKPAEEDRLTDGNLTQGYTFNQDPLGVTKYVDIEEIRRVNSMTLYTGDQNPDNWIDLSVRGYSVEISLDNFRFEEVGVLNEIGVNNADRGGYDWYEVQFPEEWARYLRFQITQPRIQYPNIGEMMVGGVGYVYEGVYESEWIDFGDAASRKNFGPIEWTADIPGGTNITIQTMTRYEAADGTYIDSAWSDPISSFEFDLVSPEPANMIKYKVNLFTQDIDVAPVFKSITFDYSDTDQPIAAGYGSIQPTSVDMGVMSDFAYTLKYSLNAGQNLKSISLVVPGEATVDSVYSSALDALVELDNVNTYSTTDTLYVSFASAIDTAASDMDEIVIYFKSELLTNVHDFNAFVFNSANNDGAGGIKIWEDRVDSWTTSTANVIDKVLTDVNAVPKVFTPNNDSKNDFTVFEFKLAKVITDVEIKVFSTDGRLVATVFDDKLTAKKYYLENKMGNADLAKNFPGYWDGKDDDGDLVPPGVYVYQVIADTDSGEKSEGGTVVVAY